MKKTQTKEATLLSPLEIVNLLHSTLETDEILNSFSTYLQQKISFNGLCYEHEKLNDNYRYGKEGSHHFIFNLSSDTFNLGKIIISKNNDFTETDIKVLEEQLCFLIQPLKNSICHYQVLQASLRDSLTDLLNRSSLNSTLQREMKLSKRHNTQLAVMMLDIDNFKLINDIHGHLAGDAVLIKIATIILESIRETDIAFRIGGEEFLIVLSDSDTIGTQKLAERLRVHVEKSTVLFNKKPIKFTVSLGISYFEAKDTQDELISRADKAMYTAKESGKNQVAIV